MTYLRLTKVNLLLLMATVAISGWPTTAPEALRRVAFGSAILMLVALTISIIQRVRRLDDQWFKCRAIAENVKSAAWFFALQPNPQGAIDRREHEDRFLEEVEKIRQRFPEQAARLAGHHTGGTEITQWMRSTQELPLADKLALLKKERIQDQISWYDRKAKSNVGREGLWAYCFIVLESTAVAAALLQVWMLWRYSTAGVVATVAAAALTWAQTRRYSDLANSYAVAAQDLRLLLERSDRVGDPSSFLALVKDVEMAISREHSMWLGRRVG